MNNISRRKLLVVGGVIAVAVVAVFLFYAVNQDSKEPVEETEPATREENRGIQQEQQLQAIERLRQERDAQPTIEAQVEVQLQEIERLRQERQSQ